LAEKEKQERNTHRKAKCWELLPGHDEGTLVLSSEPHEHGDVDGDIGVEDVDVGVEGSSS
jgi:hypothetical protein